MGQSRKTRRVEGPLTLPTERSGASLSPAGMPRAENALKKDEEKTIFWCSSGMWVSCSNRLRVDQFQRNLWLFQRDSRSGDPCHRERRSRNPSPYGPEGPYCSGQQSPFIPVPQRAIDECSNPVEHERLFWLCSALQDSCDSCLSVKGPCTPVLWFEIQG